jgi:hypothetical protein
MSDASKFQSDLDQFVQALLRGGVAPKVIGRTVEELRDHYDDLCESQTPDEARRQLGSLEEIAADLIARKELQSWSARWPWLMYILLPVAGVICAIVLGAVSVGYSWRAIEFFVGVTLVPAESVTAAVNIVFWSIAHVLPVALAVVVGWHAVITRRPLVWPVMGLIVLCMAGGALDFSANWPLPPDGPRTIEVGFAYGPPFPNLAQAVLHGMLNVSIAAGLIALSTKMRTKFLPES